MIGKLLGHTQVQTTARHAHLARDTIKASAACIGDSIEGDLEAKEDDSKPSGDSIVLKRLTISSERLYLGRRKEF